MPSTHNLHLPCGVLPAGHSRKGQPRRPFEHARRSGIALLRRDARVHFVRNAAARGVPDVLRAAAARQHLPPRRLHNEVRPRRSAHELLHVARPRPRGTGQVGCRVVARAHEDSEVLVGKAEGKKGCGRGLNLRGADFELRP